VKNNGLQLLWLKQYKWSPDAQQAFDNIQVAMTRTPILALPNFQETFTMEIDACQDGIGAVLTQKGQLIAYLSKAPGEKHRHLSIYEKKNLALIMAIEKWRHYLQRKEFIILIDHKSLAYLND